MFQGIQKKDFGALCVEKFWEYFLKLENFSESSLKNSVETEVPGFLGKIHQEIYSSAIFIIDKI